MLTVGMTVLYSVVINFVPFIIKKYKKSLIMLIGLYFCAFGIYIISPATEIGLPDRWFVMVIGFPFIGVSNALCILP